MTLTKLLKPTESLHGPYDLSLARRSATADVLRLESGELVGMVATICHFGSVDNKTKPENEKSKLRQDYMSMVPPWWCHSSLHAGLLRQQASSHLITTLSSSRRIPQLVVVLRGCGGARPRHRSCRFICCTI